MILKRFKKGFRSIIRRLQRLGVLLAVGTGVGAVLFGAEFLTQTFGHFDLPVFGETELSTVILFEAGVALTVVGVVVTIILSISEDV